MAMLGSITCTAKVESCCANDNWRSAPTQYGRPSTWKLISEYISALVLDEVWEEYHKFAKSKPDPYPRVLKPPAWKKTFSSVRARR